MGLQHWRPLMEDVDIRYAKEHLEELLARAARGEEIVITDPAIGKILLTAKVEVAPPKRGKRRLGHLKGKIQAPARLMEPMSEEELRDWYGDDA